MDATMGISAASATICTIVKSRITNEAIMAVPEIDDEPGDPALGGLEHAVGETSSADARDLLLRLVLDHLHHVVDGDNTDQPVVVVDEGADMRS